MPNKILIVPSKKNGTPDKRFNGVPVNSTKTYNQIKNNSKK